jgi:RluA family pseudouridine synthase
VSAVIKLSAAATRQFWEIPVVFENEHLLALDKPSHLLTSPDRYDPNRPNLMKLLHQDVARNAPWVRQRQITYLANAHRLDLETSGIILLAKDKPTLVELANLFGVEKPEKGYVALVHGTPDANKFKVGAKLGPHPVKIGLIRVDEKQGKRAMTHFEVMETFRGYTLLKCIPLTGRTHQIRVHLQNRGLPIVGDTLYGGQPLLLSKLKSGYRLKPNRTERPLISRVALHAEHLALDLNSQRIEITAPWPKDLTVAVKYLQRYASTSPVGEQSYEPHAEGDGDSEEQES